ncbi:MAG: hypothetical protein KIT09_31935 [Bryobacteraceae bacterium]|nr:hypothetical protein [Bryobacteraceae bacterium]
MAAFGLHRVIGGRLFWRLDGDGICRAVLETPLTEDELVQALATTAKSAAADRGGAAWLGIAFERHRQELAERWAAAATRRLQAEESRWLAALGTVIGDRFVRTQFDLTHASVSFFNKLAESCRGEPANAQSRRLSLSRGNIVTPFIPSAGTRRHIAEAR